MGILLQQWGSFLYPSLATTVGLGAQERMFRDEMTIQSLDQPGELPGGRGAQRCILPSWIQIYKVSFYGNPVANDIYISESPTKLYLAKIIMKGETDDKSVKGCVCQCLSTLWAFAHQTRKTDNVGPSWLTLG